MKFVYLIKCSNFYKIGISNNPIRRRSTIQTHNPLKVDLVATLASKNAAHVEKSYHKKFISKKTNGEWFDLSYEDLKSLHLDGFDFKVLVDDLIEKPNITHNIASVESARDFNYQFQEIKGYIVNSFGHYADDEVKLRRLLTKYSFDVLSTCVDNMIKTEKDIHFFEDNCQKWCYAIDLSNKEPEFKAYNYIRKLMVDRFGKLAYTKLNKYLEKKDRFGRDRDWIMDLIGDPYIKLDTWIKHIKSHIPLIEIPEIRLDYCSECIGSTYIYANKGEGEYRNIYQKQSHITAINEVLIQQEVIPTLFGTYSTKNLAAKKLGINVKDLLTPRIKENSLYVDFLNQTWNNILETNLLSEFVVKVDEMKLARDKSYLDFLS